MAPQQNKSFNGPPKKPLGIFKERAQIPEILNWRRVSNLALRAAISTALGEGATVSFAPASGGTGVTVRIYKGDNADTAFAGTPEQLNELLALVVEQFASTAEDPWQSFAIAGEVAERPR